MTQTPADIRFAELNAVLRFAQSKFPLHTTRISVTLLMTLVCFGSLAGRRPSFSRSRRGQTERESLLPRSVTGASRFSTQAKCASHTQDKPVSTQAHRP